MVETIFFAVVEYPDGERKIDSRSSKKIIVEMKILKKNVEREGFEQRRGQMFHT